MKTERLALQEMERLANGVLEMPFVATIRDAAGARDRAQLLEEKDRLPVRVRPAIQTVGWRAEASQRPGPRKKAVRFSERPFWKDRDVWAFFCECLPVMSFAGLAATYSPAS